jgi:hypothetical protein
MEHLLLFLPSLSIKPCRSWHSPSRPENRQVVSGKTPPSSTENTYRIPQPLCLCNPALPQDISSGRLPSDSRKGPASKAQNWKCLQFVHIKIMVMMRTESLRYYTSIHLPRSSPPELLQRCTCTKVLGSCTRARKRAISSVLL